jgi:dolichol-phosphate mannosyltransferase
LGATGFIGSQLLKKIVTVRSDVIGIGQNTSNWRLKDHQNYVKSINQNNTKQLLDFLNEYKPQTILDCTAYGAYSFQGQEDLIYATNFTRVQKLLGSAYFTEHSPTYIHAGTSSEYGDKCNGPIEDQPTNPNSHYAVSKAAVSNYLLYMGKKKQVKCANLRLFSVYGPDEDSARLMPVLIQAGIEKKFPPFVSPNISRDFVYVDDVCNAFLQTAVNLKAENYGESFNVGTGIKTSIKELSYIAKESFDINEDPDFGSYPDRAWDISEWYANIEKIKSKIGWAPLVSLQSGIEKTRDWLLSLSTEEKENYKTCSKSKVSSIQQKNSVSAIIACYKDAQAIPVMYERLVKTFTQNNIDYEIIFVNDCSPDNSEEVIRQLSAQDDRVIGISHSRNFGSQAAFRSGMEIFSKESCVLLDGDLQDPPEIIADFAKKWQEGFDIVLGRRIKREASFLMQFFYKFFYYIFNKFSYLSIPRDAGDFSLIDRRVVKEILRCNEKDLFLRGIRAYCGFKQASVDYIRPERLFGVTTNSFFKNIGWAKRGIYSFSNAPLNFLSFTGSALLAVTFLLILVQIILKIFYPEFSPKGFTVIFLSVLFFGSLNLFGISILGDYLGKVLTEVKNRPLFIRCRKIINGKLIEENHEAN